MGNYRQHITFASGLGFGYGAAAYFLAGLHWLYGSVAVLLATLGGLLPDLDSPSGVELKGFTGILGVLGALAVWQEVGLVHPPPAFEVHLWSVVVTFVLIRHGLRRVMYRFTVHRGISHSFPTMLVWAELTYLHYPSDSQAVRLMMGAGVGLGFFSHLLLDEICSVDLRGARVNKAFGTAMKFWAPSVMSTLAMYGLLSYLTYRVIQGWPDGPIDHGVDLRVPSWPRLPGTGARAESDRPDGEARTNLEPADGPGRSTGDGRGPTRRADPPDEAGRARGDARLSIPGPAPTPGRVRPRRPDSSG